MAENREEIIYSAQDNRKSGKEKLRIPARVKSARKFYLTPPTRSRPHYYVRFDVPKKIRALDPQLPKTIFRSVETDMLAVARLRARDLIEAIFDERFTDAESMKARGPSYAKLDEVLQRYQPDRNVVREETARCNRSSLRLVVKEATAKNDVGELTADVWAVGAFLQKWIAIRRARMAGMNYLEQERAATTLNSTLAQARSVLSPKVMELYAGLRLPELTSFRQVKRIGNRRDVSYRPLSPSCLEALARDVPRLKTEDPAVYKAYLLMLCLGMRNSEVFAARWNWIERRAGNAIMVIETREDFRPKNKRRREIGIHPDTLRELEEWPGVPDAWIIDAPSKTERHKICYRRLNAWLRPFLPRRQKGAYELRKHAGSVVLTQTGSIAAAAEFLGDTMAVTEKHYGKYLHEVRGISLSDVSRLAAVA